jgi:hypothetical protein
LLHVILGMKIICRKHEGLIDVPGPAQLRRLKFRFNAYVLECPVCGHQLLINMIQQEIIHQKGEAKPPLAMASGW